MKSRLLLAAMMFSASVFSQDSAFQIKDYKYRTPGFRALALDLNMSGGYFNRNIDDQHLEHRNTTSIGPFSATYYRIRSTDRRFTQNDISLSTDFRSESRKDDLEKYKIKELTNDFTWNWNSRTYGSNQYFFEIGNRLRGSLSSQKIDKAGVQSEGWSIEAANTISIGFGKGRIEWVQDAQMALHILQDLAGQGLLNRRPTAAESNLLAQLITDINNRRVFDNRRRRIYELSRIDSFFKQTGLATQTDVRHFTTINDNWAFAINPFRQSGSNWFVRINPGINLNHGRSESERPLPSASSETNRYWLHFSPEVGYENYKPVSLKWQRNFGFSASYYGQQYNSKYKTTTSAGTTEFKEDQYGGMGTINAFLAVGYFPNTRTRIDANLRVRGTMSEDHWSVQPSLKLSANYFLGYRTFLTGDASLFTFRDEFQNSAARSSGESFYSNFSLRLSHILF